MKQQKKTKPKKDSVSGRNMAGMPKKVFNVLKSFKVKEFAVDIDTGDFIRNAYLHPLFYFLSGGNRMLHVNYAGRNTIRIVVHNRLISILCALIK